MRLEIYKNEEKLNFNQSLFLEQKVDMMLNLKDIDFVEIDFTSLNNITKEFNKTLLELSFQAELKENR